MEENKLPEYEAPEVISYTEKEILALLGPARTGSGPDQGSWVG